MKRGGNDLDLNLAHCHWVVDGYGEGGGDVRVVEMVVQSTKASRVEDKVHLLPHPCDEWVGVGGGDVKVNILTWVGERRKDVRISQFCS